MKKCSSCGNSKDISEFQKRAASVDGLTASCKKCLSGRDSARYPKERKRRLEMMKVYAATPSGKRAHAKGRAHWIENNLLARAAHIIVGNAVRDGKLIKSRVCSNCGNEHKKIHAHHDDYSMPMTVRWLCPKCHAEWHKLN